MTACMLLLLAVPRDASTVLSDIGITSWQLDLLLAEIIAVALSWNGMVVLATVLLMLSKCSLQRALKKPARAEVGLGDGLVALTLHSFHAQCSCRFRLIAGVRLP